MADNGDGRTARFLVAFGTYFFVGPMLGGLPVGLWALAFAVGFTPLSDMSAHWPEIVLAAVVSPYMHAGVVAVAAGMIAGIFAARYRRLSFLHAAIATFSGYFIAAMIAVLLMLALPGLEWERVGRFGLEIVAVIVSEVGLLPRQSDHIEYLGLVAGGGLMLSLILKLVVSSVLRLAAFGSARSSL